MSLPTFSISRIVSGFFGRKNELRPLFAPVDEIVVPATAPVKVTILGTSNSVMLQGYVQGLMQTTGLEIVANTSVGSSHGVMVPLRIDDNVLARSDFVVVDLSVNEQMAVSAGLYNLDTMREMFFYILGKCQDQAVIPVFLLLPMKSHENNYAIKAHYVALCRAHGVLYYDPDDLVKSEAARTRRSWPEMFRDAYHLTPDVAQWVGRKLGEALKLADTTVSDTVEIACPQFSYVAAAPFAGGLSVIDRSTQLIAASFVRMAPGEQMTMAIEPEAAVVGIALNMSNTNANMRLQGETGLIKRLNNAFYQPEVALRLVVWQVLAPVTAKDGRIVLTCEADSPDAIVESNCHFLKRTIFPPNPVAEIAGVIVRSPIDPPVRTWRRLARPDLAAG